MRYSLVFIDAMIPASFLAPLQTRERGSRPLKDGGVSGRRGKSWYAGRPRRPPADPGNRVMTAASGIRQSGSLGTRFHKDDTIRAPLKKQDFVFEIGEIVLSGDSRDFFDEDPNAEFSWMRVNNPGVRGPLLPAFIRDLQKIRVVRQKDGPGRGGIRQVLFILRGK